MTPSEPLQQPETRLLQLLDTVLDGSYSEADRAEFSRLLEVHPELTPLVVKQLRTHALLNWKLAPSTLAPQGVNVVSVGDETDDAPEFVCELKREDESRPRHQGRGTRWHASAGWIAATAAAL